ncbi:MAG TPA: hypothetical protein PK304_02045 [Mobilitalea sp.]|nr:hypothetical protein [Mobilitalea sp.]
MPIRPIDIVKSHDASQYMNLQKQKIQHEQVQISKNFQNIIQAEASRPVETTKSENNEFRYDAKEESRNKYKGPKYKKKQKESNNKKTGNTGGRPGGIDILI